MRLVLNDGTIIEGGKAGYSEGFLWLYFTGYTLQQAAIIAFDGSKMSHIVFEYGEMSKTYDGFTVCINLNIDIDGNISVCMKRGES